MPSFLLSSRQALRRGRVSIPSQIYLLTTTARHRRPLFADIASARAVSRVIHSASTWRDSRLLAWVLMPDHWHGLLRLGDEPLGRVMNRFKGGTSRALHAAGEMEGAPWERSFHDHALRSREDVRKVARYIVANPIRAGLVDNVLGYPYWNAVWLEYDPSTLL